MKILAAVVGLYLAVLLLGVLVLLIGIPSDRGVPPDLLRRLSRVQANPGVGADERRTRAVAFKGLAESAGVEAAVWLEEAPDANATPLIVGHPEGPRPPSAAETKRAVILHRAARAQGQAQVLDHEMLVLLEGGFDRPREPDEAPVRPDRRQSAYVRWSATGGDLGRVRTLYFTLLGGIAAVTAVAWILLSRLVVRPLAALAEAASRVAAGDMAARVPTTGAGDEFDRTANAFNRMASEVGEHQGQLEDRVMAALSRVRKAEQHLAIAQRLAATGKLASGIAHEINNPLGGMRNAVRALQRGDLDAAKTAEYLELVQDGLARVEDTVKKVLSFTPRNTNPRTTDLGEVVRKAAALARHRIERKGIRFDERYPQGEPARVFGDAHELQQVALNLLLNAADAIPERDESGAPRPSDRGRIGLEVRTEGDSALLLIEDDGVGMTPEVQAQCFDLFFTTKEVGEGTGLGLAVVHNVVTNHGGSIEVESAPGKGTTFRVVLPKEGASGPDGPAGAGVEGGASGSTGSGAGSAVP